MSSLPHQQSETSGVTPFQQSGYQDGATSPRSNAMTYRNNQIAQQQTINRSGGSKRKKRQNGGEGSVVVPSFSTPGPSVSAGGQSANANSASANTTSTQSSANASCDSCIGGASKTVHCQSAACNPQAGGGSCNGSGLIGPNQTWGCMSGGKSKRKKRKQTKKRKNKKSKKTKKRNNKK